MNILGEHMMRQEMDLARNRNALSQRGATVTLKETRSLGASGEWLRGHWAQTASGNAFYPLDPRPEDICIYDIAAGLSRLCRYAGQLRDDVEHYSIAEHSVCLVRYFYERGEIDLARWALMHDAAEFCGELISPIKHAVSEYRTIEARIMRVICRRFGLPSDEPDAVKRADLRILLDERAAVMAPPPAPWEVEDLDPLGAIIVCYPSRMARAAFMHWFGVLFPNERNSFARRETGGADGARYL